jgi:ABC-type glycerol-3-phosphate transport system permease component
MTRARLRGVAWAATALGAILFAITPILWMLLTSVKSNREITQETSLVPQALTTANYISLFSGREFASYLTNSVIVTSLSVAIALILAHLPAFQPYLLNREGGFAPQPRDEPAAHLRQLITERKRKVAQVEDRQAIARQPG